jgi:hypothetical protein
MDCIIIIIIVPCLILRVEGDVAVWDNRQTAHYGLPPGLFAPLMMQPLPITLSRV